MTTKFIYQCDSKVYPAKPTCEDCSGINARLANKNSRKTGSLTDFVKDSLKYSVAPYEIDKNGGKSLSASIWRKKQIFLFDFDNKPEDVNSGAGPIDLDQAVAVFIQAGLDVAAAWTTASHSNEQPRFRIMLVTMKPIEDINVCRRFGESVAWLVKNAGGLVADEQALNPTQLFFAGKEVRYKDLRKTVDGDACICRAEQQGMLIKRSTERVDAVESTVLVSHWGNENDIVNLIQSKNINGLRSWLQQQQILPLWRAGVVKDKEAEKADEIWADWVLAGVSTYNNLSHLIPTLEQYSDKVDTSGQSCNPSIIISDAGDLYVLYSMLPLDVFFGVKRNHRCLFHDDQHPSAQISCSDKSTDIGLSKQYRYYCNSVNCALPKRSGRKGNSLIDLIMHIQGATKQKALDFLNDVFGIHIADHRWRQAKKEAIDWFCTRTESPCFSMEYPRLHELLRHHGDKLKSILRYIRDNMPANSLTGDGRLVFSVALRTLKRIMKEDNVSGVRNVNRLNRRLKTFGIYGLLEIADPDSLPSRVVSLAKERSKQGPPEQSFSDSDYFTQFFIVPDYDEDMLRQAEEAAVFCRDHKVSRKQVNRDSCEKTFGNNGMILLFPQQKERIVRDKVDERLYNNLRSVISKILDENGFCSKSMALASLRGYKNEVKEQAYAKYVPGIMQELNLTWGVIGQKMRKEYGFNGGKAREHALVRKQPGKVDANINPAA